MEWFWVHMSLKRMDAVRAANVGSVRYLISSAGRLSEAVALPEENLHEASMTSTVVIGVGSEPAG